MFYFLSFANNDLIACSSIRCQTRVNCTTKYICCIWKLGGWVLFRVFLWVFFVRHVLHQNKIAIVDACYTPALLCMNIKQQGKWIGKYEKNLKATCHSSTIIMHCIWLCYFLFHYITKWYVPLIFSFMLQIFDTQPLVSLGKKHSPQHRLQVWYCGW